MSLIAQAKDLQGRIHEAFGGRPFLPGVPPNAPANIRRFNDYSYMLYKTGRVLHKAADLFAISARREDSDEWQNL